MVNPMFGQAPQKKGIMLLLVPLPSTIHYILLYIPMKYHEIYEMVSFISLLLVHFQSFTNLRPFS